MYIIQFDHVYLYLYSVYLCIVYIGYNIEQSCNVAYLIYLLYLLDDVQLATHAEHIIHIVLLHDLLRASVTLQSSLRDVQYTLITGKSE